MKLVVKVRYLESFIVNNVIFFTLEFYEILWKGLRFISIRFRRWIGRWRKHRVFLGIKFSNPILYAFLSSSYFFALSLQARKTLLLRIIDIKILWLSPIFRSVVQNFPSIIILFSWQMCIFSIKRLETKVPVMMQNLCN